MPQKTLRAVVLISCGAVGVVITGWLLWQAAEQRIWWKVALLSPALAANVWTILDGIRGSDAPARVDS